MICPNCGTELKEKEVGKGLVLWCPYCYFNLYKYTYEDEYED